jgi:hypothetical protein
MFEGSNRRVPRNQPALYEFRVNTNMVAEAGSNCGSPPRKNNEGAFSKQANHPSRDLL